MLIYNFRIMKTSILFLLGLILMISCKTASVNQTINKKREGLWLNTFEIDTVIYHSRGKFKNDDEIRTWRFYENKRLARKSKFQKNACIKTFYHSNGKIESRGKTKTNYSDKLLHWYYDGLWKFYDKKGNLIETKKYNKGTLETTTKHQKNNEAS